MDFCHQSMRSICPAPQWRRAFERALRAAQLDYEPVPLVGWMGGMRLLAGVRHLGGTARFVGQVRNWVLEPSSQGVPRALAALVPELIHGNTVIHDFIGAVEIELDGTRYLALRTDVATDQVTVDHMTLLGAPTLAMALEFAARVKQAMAELSSADLEVFGSVLRPDLGPLVSEDDLILPPGFAQDLMGYVDRFWEATTTGALMSAAPTRGLLLVGAPGTGKTLTVRHLLRRHPKVRRFAYIAEGGPSRFPGSPFRSLLDALSRSEQPAIVVIEDLDRILDSRQVTAEFLLNSLDGLFRPQVPVLWLATSNDPSALPDNLLNRPGRFDRVFVFPEPGPAERERLFTRYSPWPVAPDVLNEIVFRSPGLTPAHIKEVCIAAALTTVREPAQYGATLKGELERVRTQHQRARAYGDSLGRMSVGFGNGGGVE